MGSAPFTAKLREIAGKSLSSLNRQQNPSYSLTDFKVQRKDQGHFYSMHVSYYCLQRIHAQNHLFNSYYMTKEIWDCIIP